MNETKRIPEWVAAALLAVLGVACIVVGLANPYQVARLMLMDADGSNRIELAFTRVHSYFQLEWAPEGAIYYTGDPSGDLDLFVLSRDTASSRSVTLNLYDDSGPSIRGDFLLYAGRVDGDYEILLRDIPARQTARLTENDVNDLSPQWSPDGARLAFATGQTGQLEIATMTAEGEDVRVITDTPRGASYPAWSPDGARLAFMVQGEDDNVDVWASDADGANLTQLTDSAGFDGYPRWSPDGAAIVFHSDRTGDEDVWLLDVASGEARNLTDNPRFEEGFPVWSPDGTQILYRSEGPQPRTNVLAVGGMFLLLAAGVMVIWRRRNTPSAAR